MKCSYCNETAVFKCDCQKPFMCQSHLGFHITLKNHPYENLNEKLGDLRLNQLRSKLVERIQKVNLTKNILATKSKLLIKSIERYCKQASDNLSAIINSYIELLKRDKFCPSELHKIEQIESVDINVRTIEMDAITNLVKNTYSIDLITFGKKIEENNLKKEAEERKRKKAEERNRKEQEGRKRTEEGAWKMDEINLFRSNSYLEMTLKQRIDFFYPKVNEKVWCLNTCKERGREILVSNDGKYLFFCKLYLGMIQ